VLGVVYWLVVAERADPGLIELAPELRDREVVAELVVVPVVVHPGRLADPAHVGDSQLAPIHRPLLRDAERGAVCPAGNLGIRVDRVPEVDVEVVPFVLDRPEGPEAAPEGLLRPGLMRPGFIAGVGEADR